MSLSVLRSTVDVLPFALSDQVVGYAEAVERALPGIFKDANHKFDRKLADQIVFLAGIKKLHSIVASSYWTLDTSGKLLEGMGNSHIRIGGGDFSRGGELHQNLYSLLRSLELALTKQGIYEYMRLRPSDMLERLASNGRF